MNTLRGNQLHPDDRAHVLRAYIYRQTIENNQANPACVKRAGGRLPLIPDALWLQITAWQVTKAGRIDRRTNHCHTHNHEIPEHKAILDKWNRTKN